jgi:hypothetical protein
VKPGGDKEGQEKWKNRGSQGGQEEHERARRSENEPERARRSQEAWRSKEPGRPGGARRSWQPGNVR